MNASDAEIYHIKNTSDDRVNVKIFEAYDNRTKRIVSFMLYDTNLFTLETADTINYGLIDDTVEGVDDEGNQYTTFVEYIDDEDGEPTMNTYTLLHDLNQLIVEEDVRDLKWSGNGKRYGL